MADQPGEPNEFEVRCAVLLETRAVTPETYRPPGVRRYRFDTWLYDYLESHPELLEGHPERLKTSSKSRTRASARSRLAPTWEG